MIYSKIIKQLGAVCFLLGSVIFLSGCLDSGLNLMAKKHQAKIATNPQTDEEINPQTNEGVSPKTDEGVNGNTETEVSEGITDDEGSDMDKLLEDQTAEQMIEVFFKELGDFIEKASQLMENKEEGTNQEGENGLSTEDSEEDKEDSNNSSQESSEQSETIDNIDSVEDGLITCDQIDSAHCQTGSVVCAQVKAQTESGEEIEWLEFENACQACQNSSQKIGNMTLEIVGFKEGKCKLP
ncbi:MAG: hypothetical protein U9Q72_01520 [Patescibacteria group bacterium]|nr:hypothetical protein [Patescibacteria group bacterium]